MISEKRKKLFVYFFDYTEALDRVKHNKIIEVLANYEIPPEETKLISNLYWNQTALVRTKLSIRAIRYQQFC